MSKNLNCFFKAKICIRFFNESSSICLVLQCFFFAFNNGQTSKRLVSPDGKLLSMPMDTLNTSGVTSALSAFGGCGGVWGRRLRYPYSLGEFVQSVSLSRS